MKDRQFGYLVTVGATVFAALSVVGCDRITEPVTPAPSSTVTSLPQRSPLGAVVPDGAPVAARLLGNNYLNLHGFGWQELYGIALLTRPTGGGVESYVNTTIESPWMLHHTPTSVQLTDVNIILDGYGLVGSQTLLSFRVTDGFGNLIQERILDTPLVLR